MAEHAEQGAPSNGVQAQAVSHAASARKRSEGPSNAVMGTYGRQNVVFERGEGSWLIATDGTRYLDFGSGVAVNTLGHCHPHLIAALTEQASKVWHTSNLYRIDEQERLAERLCEATFGERVFFCNSGAEACEGLIKLARRYQFVSGHPERNRIITFSGAFHGRTLATISAAGNEKYTEGFGPDMPGFDHVPFGDHDALHAAISDETAAIMVEPVQGEGGLAVVPKQCLEGLRALCDERGILLLFDEVQCGVGRTGKLFAHEWAGVTPDAMSIAKGIGGGFPLGAFIATEEAAKGMVPGTHGSTYGGNPLATAVGNAVLDVVLQPGFLEDVEQRANAFRQSLAQLADENPDMVEGIRGQGFLTGIKVKPANIEVVQAAFAEHLLTVPAGDNVVRMIPPLNVTREDLAESLVRLGRAFQTIRDKQAADGGAASS
jgi:acetylornithine/N-succinyldiaminopimelate aminotransferase